MQEVFLIMSNNGIRTKVYSIASTLEKAKELVDFLDSTKPENCIRETDGSATSYYRITDDNTKQLLERVYIEKRGVI